MNSGLTSGAPVYTADGAELGRVKEIRGDYFKVAAPMQPDYWLCSDVVGSAGDAVRLTFEIGHLQDHMEHPPER